ncbi:TPA: H-NS family nucleoid-associated regulatory protein [Burkholderia cenocepacia]|nr:H-NS family nucleoid-associated regulatory protein [Burkholderia cenocepacia]
MSCAQGIRDPKTGATWSGRGREPGWIKGKNANGS